MSDKDTVEVVDAQGRFGTVAKRDLDSGLRSGAIRLPTEDDYKAFKLRQETTTPAQKALAGAEGVGRALSFGLSDIGAQKLGLTTSEMQKARKENNPNISATGEAVGYIAPALLTGGTSTAAEVGALGAAAKVGKILGTVPRAISRAGLAAEEAVAGRMALTGGEKLAARIVKSALPKAAGSAVEGALIGGQQAVTEAALGDHELTASNVLGHMGTGALLGFGVGGTLGAATPIASAMGSTAKQVGKNLLRLANFDTSLEGMAQSSALRAARVKPAVFDRTPKEVMQKAAQYAMDEGVITGTSTPASIAEASSVKMKQVGGQYENILARLDAADKKPGVGVKLVDDAYPRVEKIFERIDKEVLAPMRETSLGAQEAAKLESKIQPFLSKMAETPNVSFRQLFNERVGFQNAINYERANPTAVTAGLKKVRNILDDVLEKDGDKAAKAIGDESFLKDYKTAKEGYRYMSIINKAASKAASQDAARNLMPGLADMMIGGAVTGAGALATGGMGTVPALALGAAASKGVQFARARGDAALAGVLNNAAKASKLVEVEKASNSFSNSLKKSVTSFFTESAKATPPVMAPLWAKNDANKEIDQVRKAVANMDAVNANIQQRTTQLAEAAPTVAMHMQVQAQSAAAFLAKALPTDRNPARLLTPNATNLEPHYAPSEVDRFMRYKRVVTDPKTVIEDMKNGRLSPDAVTALKMVYPPMYNQIVKDAMEAVAASKSAIPYNKRVQLSILLEKPLDPSLEPKNMQMLQARFGTPTGQPKDGPKQNKSIGKATSFSTPVMMDNLYPGKSKNKGI